MKSGFTVKELSNFTFLSPRTIRYYDKIGLFKPTYIDKKTSYRYYSIEKLEELRLIHYMRYLDIPIKEIKSHLENKSIDNYEELLESHLEKTEQKILHLKSIKIKLENRMNSVKKVKNIPFFDKVIMENIDPQNIVKVETEFEHEEDWERELGKIESKLKLPPNLVIGSICFSIRKENLENSKFNKYNSLMILLDDLQYISEKDVAILSENKCISIYFKGNHKSSPKYYEIMMDYIKKNNLVICGDSVECTLIDHYISGDENLHITNIKIPVL